MVYGFFSFSSPLFLSFFLFLIFFIGAGGIDWLWYVMLYLGLSGWWFGIGFFSTFGAGGYGTCVCDDVLSLLYLGKSIAWIFT